MTCLADNHARVPAGLRLAARRNIRTRVARNRPSTIGLSVDDALGAGNGGLLVVEARAPALRRRDPWATTTLRLLVQVTGLGLTTRTDRDHVYVVVTGARDGAAGGRRPRDAAR